MQLFDEFLKEVSNLELLTDESFLEDFSHDESLTLQPEAPLAVIFPKNEEEVIALARAANKYKIPLTPRGAGSGMSGACAPRNSVVVAFEKFNQIIEIDTFNHVAVVEPGVRLFELDQALLPFGLFYPVYPGELSATIGGNISTNAGGMRAIKYGVTRNHVLSLRAVLIDGSVIQSGGKLLKSSVGYDLTQLIIGSEGTLGLITQAVLKLSPRLAVSQGLLSAFPTLEKLAATVPMLLAKSIGPSVCEYIDNLTLDAITASANLQLGISQEIKNKTEAYLLLSLESNSHDHLEALTEYAGEILEKAGASDTFVLSPSQTESLISAREKAFYVAKAAGATDIIDVVVPRSEMAPFLREVAKIAEKYGVLIPGCGHIGDGNVHLALFAQDSTLVKKVMTEVLELGILKGGAISGEHGIGTEKRQYFLTLEQPSRLNVLRAIKKAFDPEGLLNPEHLI
jgi:glycolate oxidase